MEDRKHCNDYIVNAALVVVQAVIATSWSGMAFGTVMDAVLLVALLL